MFACDILRNEGIRYYYTMYRHISTTINLWVIYYKEISGQLTKSFKLERFDIPTKSFYCVPWLTQKMSSEHHPPKKCYILLNKQQINK